MGFLPITKKEIDNLGWDYIDIIIVSGDAYIDHPSFGHAVIARTLEAAGYRVAIIPQPNWRDDLRDFKKLGKPRLFFGITSGVMDSMVNHYTANKRLRSDDAYTPNAEAGYRPDYATTVYSNILKEIYPDTPIILGGIEASMRRNAHYDYWSDTLKPSILIDSKADMLVYGMGEKIIVQIANRLNNGEKIDDIKDIYQTGFLAKDIPTMNSCKTIELPSYEECLKDKYNQAKSIFQIETTSNKITGERLVQKHNGNYVIINPFDPNFTSKDLDKSFALPYEREPHPKYKKRGTIPAFDMIKFSVNIHRGCFGGCSFCTIASHQGKQIISRSEKSILKEIEAISHNSDFKGYLSDLGGPSANMYKMKGIDRKLCDNCSKPSCIFPQICPNLNFDHKPLLNLYEKVRALPYIKKAFVGSGVRYDLFIGIEKEKEKQYSTREYFETLFLYHVSGRLKVAPEHTEEHVLKLMRKPSFNQFIELKHWFDILNKKYDLRQQLIPYFISSHPACTLKDMQSLAQKTKDLGYHLEQVQDFTPTPMTISTETYYTGLNIKNQEKIFVEKSPEGKKKQNAAFFWWKKK